MVLRGPIAITGAAGQLGRELCRCFADAAVPLDRAAMDIRSREQVRRVIGELQPAAVINCAAYTLVDRAEKDPESCWDANAGAVGWLAEACREADCCLVQISTDYVFGGDRARATPYREEDPPLPLGVYAQSKWEGEKQAAAWENHLIVRTCGLYGRTERGGNFVETMLRLAREGKPLRVVDDQWCTPSYVADVAAAIEFLLGSGATGIYHVTDAGATTWRRFAVEIFQQAGIAVDVEPITTEQFGAPAPRPRYSVLDTGKYQKLQGSVMPFWADALSRYLNLR